jgi:hypothetical protein
MEPTVLACLMKMYTKCNEPEQVQNIWNTIVNNNIRPDSTLYTTVLTAIAEWAKKSGVPDVTHDETKTTGPMLDLGQTIHRHIISSRIR